MRKATVFVHNQPAVTLTELMGQHYQFTYADDYAGSPVSLTMPTSQKIYNFESFPPFFEGLLPEGDTLEILLKKYKLDRNDFFGQLIILGMDVVGAITVKEVQ